MNSVLLTTPYRNQIVYNVNGLVTAVGPDGLWIRSMVPGNDIRTSESIYVSGKITTNVTLTTGDIIALDGIVSEYRSSPVYIHLAEITRPTNVRTVSRGNKVKPVVLGMTRSLLLSSIPCSTIGMSEGCPTTPA